MGAGKVLNGICKLEEGRRRIRGMGREKRWREGEGVKATELERERALGMELAGRRTKSIAISGW